MMTHLEWGHNNMTLATYQSMASNGGYNLLLLHGFDQTKRKVFHYIAIKRNKLSILKKEIRNESIKLEQYGHVLASEYGYAPSKRTQESVIADFQEWVNSENK